MILHNFEKSTIRLDSDFDERKYQVTYKIPFKYLTKAAYEAIKKELREEYPRYTRTGCGHDWDCCGCVYSTSADITYSSAGVVVILTEYLNY